MTIKETAITVTHPARISSTEATLSYEQWMEILHRLAHESELGWLVSTQTDAHRDAFDKGLSPDEELHELAMMAEWRGCGCGGG